MGTSHIKTGWFKGDKLQADGIPGIPMKHRFQAEIQTQHVLLKP